MADSRAASLGLRADFMVNLVKEVQYSFRCTIVQVVHLFPGHLSPLAAVHCVHLPQHNHSVRMGAEQTVIAAGICLRWQPRQTNHTAVLRRIGVGQFDDNVCIGTGGSQSNTLVQPHANVAYVGVSN